MGIGFIISIIVAAVLGTIFAIVIGTLNSKVTRNKLGNIDFSKSDIYFRWTRWDYVIIVAAIYTFLCIVGLLLFLIRGDNIESPWIQFFIHQTYVFFLLTSVWFITRIAFLFKGIKERWSDEFE